MRILKILTFLFLLISCISYSQGRSHFEGEWEIKVFKHNDKPIDLTDCENYSRFSFGVADDGYYRVLYKNDRGRCPNSKMLFLVYEVRVLEDKTIIRFLQKNSNGYYDIFDTFEIHELSDNEILIYNNNDTMRIQRIY